MTTYLQLKYIVLQFLFEHKHASCTNQDATKYLQNVSKYFHTIK